MQKKIDIPVYQPDLSGNELAYVTDCIKSGWISSRGTYVERFEREFAEFVGVEHAASVCNGTVALHLALLALGIGPGDEVIVPTFTYIASVNAIIYTGATPVFADSSVNTWQIDPQDIQRHITPRTKAILAVHIYGHPCEIDALREISSRHRIFLVEDCAEAIGSRVGSKHVGSTCDISTFSFFGNKTMTTGEGGMVLTNDRTLIERCRHLKGQGLAKHREYWHDIVGYNYRMTNIQAAIGLAQMERLSDFVSEKRALAKYYQEALAGTPLIFHGERPGYTHSHWMVSVLARTPDERNELRNHLAEDGIETRPAFYPVHTMPMYSKSYLRHPGAEYLAWRGINIPSWPALSIEQRNRVTESIRRFYD